MTKIGPPLGRGLAGVDPCLIFWENWEYALNQSNIGHVLECGRKPVFKCGVNNKLEIRTLKLRKKYNNNNNN